MPSPEVPSEALKYEHLSDDQLVELPEEIPQQLSTDRLLRLYKNLQEENAILAEQRDQGLRRIDMQDSKKVRAKKETRFKLSQQEKIEKHFSTHLPKLRKILEAKGINPPTMEQGGL